MNKLYDLIIVQSWFLFLGTPLGVSIFWIGIGLHTEAASADSDMVEAFLTSVIGLVAAIPLGSVFGAFFSIFNGIVFWCLVSLVKLQINIRILGILAGVSSFLMLMTVHQIRELFQNGSIDLPRVGDISFAWMTISGGVTGFVLSSAVERRLRTPTNT